MLFPFSSRLWLIKAAWRWISMVISKLQEWQNNSQLSKEPLRFHQLIPSLESKMIQINYWGLHQIPPPNQPMIATVELFRRVSLMHSKRSSAVHAQTIRAEESDQFVKTQRHEIQYHSLITVMWWQTNDGLVGGFLMCFQVWSEIMLQTGICWICWIGRPFLKLLEWMLFMGYHGDVVLMLRVHYCRILPAQFGGRCAPISLTGKAQWNFCNAQCAWELWPFLIHYLFWFPASYGFEHVVETFKIFETWDRCQLSWSRVHPHLQSLDLFVYVSVYETGGLNLASAQDDHRTTGKLMVNWSDSLCHKLLVLGMA